MARERGLNLLQPRLLDEHFIKMVRSFNADLVVVAGYHKRIPAEVLAMPRLGAINLHGSLLPKFRGPCPWKHVLIAGETESGATVHIMTEEFDSGDILGQRRIPVLPHYDAEQLFQATAQGGAELLVDCVRDIEEDRQTRTPQNPELATYYGNPSPEACRISWDAPSNQIISLIRGLSPRPGAWTLCDNFRLRVLQATVARTGASATPGRIKPGNDAIEVATSDGSILVTRFVVEECDPTTIPQVLSAGYFE
jgi:methionyl-tRNA formyltransferase